MNHQRASGTAITVVRILMVMTDIYQGNQPVKSNKISEKTESIYMYEYEALI